MIQILQNEYLQLLVWLFVLTYGLAFGLNNWIIRIIALFGDGKFYISDIGQILDVLWLIAVTFLLWTLF